MCRECLIDVRPERDRTCLETGVYLLNYSQCMKCKFRTPLVISERNREEETDEETNDYEETITYHHSCSICSHLISEHYYQFTVTHPEGITQQDYLMDCVLCGRGADTSTVIRDIQFHAARTTYSNAPELATTDVQQVLEEAEERKREREERGWSGSGSGSGSGVGCETVELDEFKRRMRGEKLIEQEEESNKSSGAMAKFMLTSSGLKDSVATALAAAAAASSDKSSNSTASNGGEAAAGAGAGAGGSDPAAGDSSDQDEWDT